MGYEECSLWEQMCGMFFGREPNDFIRGDSEDLMRVSPGEAGGALLHTFKNVGRQKKEVKSEMLSPAIPASGCCILNLHRFKNRGSTEAISLALKHESFLFNCSQKKQLL